MRTRAPTPLSPEAAAVLSGQNRTSRRTVLRGLVAATGLLATGCGMPGTRQDPAACRATDESGSDKSLVVSNWPLYIDVDEDDESKRPTLDAFMSQTGIQVTYQEDVNDNNEFFGKVRNQLSTCQAIDRDIVVLTDWMAARMIRLGWVQPLRKDKLPNVDANLLPQLRGRPWDRKTEYAVPWQSGLAGIAFNGNVTSEVRTVEELLTRPDLRGKVTCLSEMRDTMGLILRSNGHDPSDFTEEQFDGALNTLQAAVDSGQIRRFTGNDYAQDLAKGDIAACVGWSGDVIQLNFEDEKVQFVVPESGAMLWSDNMQVPNEATHQTNAEMLMNYYYEPAVAAELAAYVNYICPVVGAQDEMANIDPELAENELIFPSESTLANTKVFMALNEAQERIYEQRFQQVIGA
ncbi:ABC transporter substrate-binding protein [Actinophytocola oryzae]|uniref:Spermidine/putrescine transport system substrate-binding protein n=1 Tax=Actinophytocola oryzae TaxID=502181 RepID=A0A4R7VYH6_9PSEU|nr:spermidine/putrescine ABC transporter substrate-binding protein [Actinophytocola oryzae]TDV55082.1 spermidine/putrescine transport system substrate-binding protein [Actinophytocola oryzae]